MKAISLWQPWASAMALGLKTIETRSWRTGYLGELAICAASRKSAEQRRIFSGLLAADCSISFTFQQAFANTEVGLDDLPFGCVVAVGKLSAVGDIYPFFSGTDGAERMLGDYSRGRFGWKFTEIKALRTPVPMAGHQRIFNLPAEVESKVKAQL